MTLSSVSFRDNKELKDKQKPVRNLGGVCQSVMIRSLMCISANTCPESLERNCLEVCLPGSC